MITVFFIEHLYLYRLPRLLEQAFLGLCVRGLCRRHASWKAILGGKLGRGCRVPHNVLWCGGGGRVEGYSVVGKCFFHFIVFWIISHSPSAFILAIIWLYEVKAKWGSVRRYKEAEHGGGDSSGNISCIKNVISIPTIWRKCQVFSGSKQNIFF